MFAKTYAYPMKLNSRSWAPATNAPRTISPTARYTGVLCVVPANTYSAPMVNAAVVLLRVVYMGRETPRTDAMDRSMYTMYAADKGATRRNIFAVGNPVRASMQSRGMSATSSVNRTHPSFRNAYSSTLEHASCASVMTLALGNLYADSAALLKKSSATARPM